MNRTVSHRLRRKTNVSTNLDSTRSAVRFSRDVVRNVVAFGKRAKRVTDEIVADVHALSQDVRDAASEFGVIAPENGKEIVVDAIVVEDSR